MRATRTQRLAAFLAARRKTLEFAVLWSITAPSDDEIHQISDAAVEAALAIMEEGKEK